MEKLRLGGMALQNGVLVHGPHVWGAAVRLENGTVKAASGRKPTLAPGVTVPFLRGPLRLAEAFAVLPALKRGLPEAKEVSARLRAALAGIGSRQAKRLRVRSG